MLGTDLIEQLSLLPLLWRHLLKQTPKVGNPTSFGASLVIGNSQNSPHIVNKFCHKFFLRQEGFCIKSLDLERLLSGIMKPASFGWEQGFMWLSTWRNYSSKGMDLGTHLTIFGYWAVFFNSSASSSYLSPPPSPLHFISNRCLTWYYNYSWYVYFLQYDSLM